MSVFDGVAAVTVVGANAGARDRAHASRRWGIRAATGRRLLYTYLGT
jgi:hypothetical protein